MRERIGFLYLAAQNLRRRPGRSLLSAAGVVLATASFFAGLVTLLGTERSVRIGLDRLGADMLVVPAGHAADVQEALVAGRPAGFFMDGSALDAVKKIGGVTAAAPQVFLPGQRPGDPVVAGFDPEADFTVLPWLEARLPGPLAADEAIAGANTGHRPGGTVQLYGETFRVAGRLLRTGGGADRMLFVRRDAVYRLARRAQESGAAGPAARLSPGAVSAILLRVEEWVPPEIVVTQIRSKVPEAEVVRRGEVAREVAQGQVRAVRGLLLVVAVLLGIALVMVGVLFSATVSERQRELGLVRAMGAGAGQLLGLILTEAVLLTTLSGLVGVVLGAGMVLAGGRWIAAGLRVPYLWPPPALTAGIAAGTAAVAALMGVVSAAYPAVRAALMEPYEAIRSGE
ncbi:ABC transporter permease [Caldinitratiruptor microaerophilus]|uniref:Putative hemin transport system permease protein HrtB n=1 Tax=Caldinitratiruptor microaerophilus TaxID=671077 RepID=A0AA35CLQ8_9FIRM|nr:ABC transporter permease [Caldinitratiruptor microaerophilus]BDG60718.1 ABC transporter permease [Caldinitratiruptor microaerophilus]